jgi:putative hydrolases of HD superfamily
MDDRIRRQLDFLLELDKAKSVYRRSHVTAEDRNENDAEHMWHLAMCVLVLAEHAGEPIDALHALKLVLVHDIVEIDAGDVYIYDESGAAAKEALETAAADRIYALLPDDQRDELRALWEEFEAKETPEARFAGSVDRLAPLLLNHATEGRSWREHGITSERVRSINKRIELGSPALWEVAQELIDDAVAEGYLPD